MLGDEAQNTLPPIQNTYDGNADLSTSGDETTEADLAARADIKAWQDKIRAAKLKWDQDHERMRDNMDFVAGIQWAAQKGIAFDKYICNLTLRAVNQGVATLYARNPKVVAKRRPRLDFTMWDGHMETIEAALSQGMQASQGGMEVPPQLMGVLNDFEQGRQKQALTDKICETLRLTIQYQFDSQTPRFKLQMKQLVRRVNVCGVGYIKVLFSRDGEEPLTQSETRLNISDRIKRAQGILEQLQDGNIDESDKEIEQLKQLIASLSPVPLDCENTYVKEHITFDFPQATSIIPDPNTRTLKGFVGAHWVVEEQYRDLEFVNAFYNVDIKVGGDLQTYGYEKRSDGTSTYVQNADVKCKKVRLWIVTNLDDKSSFTICDGWKDYVEAPAPISPCTKGFWQLFPVTFNDIEVEDGCRASIFPPSVVDLLKPAQKEWNRSREALRRHRKANSPRYVYPKGSLDEEDEDNIESAEDQMFFALKGINPGVEPGKVLQALQTEPIHPEVYDTSQLREDTLLATGQQEANMGPAQPNVTATVGSIAEQSRMAVSASDVDGLDDSFTEVAQCAGELILIEFSPDTVRRIAGNGAAWPQLDKSEYLNEIIIEIVAASSGRPNKAVEIDNWNKISGILMQAGANPQAIIRETIKRFDDALDPADFFPLPMAPQQQLGPGQQAPEPPFNPSQNGQQQMNPLPSGSPTQP